MILRQNGGFSSSIGTKKSISKKTQSLIKSMKKKYSSQKKSAKRILESHHFVQRRIEENQIKIAQYQNSLQDKTVTAKIFNLGTNPQLMESVLFLVKMTICALLLPLTIYLQQHPKGEHSFHNLQQFFISQHSGTIVTILSQSALEHPVAITFLTEKFIFNPLGRILMKFSLFSGIVHTMKQIKEGKQVLERKVMDVIGRSLFNYETFYAIKYAIESFSLPKPGMSTIEKAKYISKVSGTVLTLFDLILCGTKSSWCQSLQPLQRVTYVFPTFVELGTAVYDIVEGSQHHLGKKQPIEVMSLGFQHYCKKTFKMGNLYLDYSKMSIKDQVQKIVVPEYSGPAHLQKSYEAKFRLQELMADPEKLMKMAQENPNFEQELMTLKTQSEYFENTKDKQQKMSQIKKEVKELVEDIRDPEKVKGRCSMTRQLFLSEQRLLKENMNTKGKQLLAPVKKLMTKVPKFSMPSVKEIGVVIATAAAITGVVYQLNKQKTSKQTEEEKPTPAAVDEQVEIPTPQAAAKATATATAAPTPQAAADVPAELTPPSTTTTTTTTAAADEPAGAAAGSLVSKAQLGIGAAALVATTLGLCSRGYKNKVVAEHVNKEAEKISKNINHQPQNMEEKVNHVSPKRMNKYVPFKDKIKSSLLMGLISSLAAVSEDSLDIKELNKLLSDKYLTKEQQQQVQELINQIKKKRSKKKSLKKKNN